MEISIKFSQKEILSKLVDKIGILCNNRRLLDFDNLAYSLVLGGRRK
jgi:hypothetical protein